MTAGSTRVSHPSPTVAHTTLDIGRMTCAPCAARIERKLNKLDGVNASVNYATEQATVTYPDTLDRTTLIATVEAAGYTATVPATSLPGCENLDDTEADANRGESDPTATLRQRLAVSTTLALPVLAMAMIPALQPR